MHTCNCHGRERRSSLADVRGNGGSKQHLLTGTRVVEVCGLWNVVHGATTVSFALLVLRIEDLNAELLCPWRLSVGLCMLCTVSTGL